MKLSLRRWYFYETGFGWNGRLSHGKNARMVRLYDIADVVNNRAAVSHCLGATP
jgi:hypothetical protein